MYVCIDGWYDGWMDGWIPPMFHCDARESLQDLHLEYYQEHA